MSSHCNISQPCFFTQLNLLIHFASKPICLSSRSQTVLCPRCSLFSCSVYFPPSPLLYFLWTTEPFPELFAPREIEGISVHISVPPPPPPSLLPSAPLLYLSLHLLPRRFTTVLKSGEKGFKNEREMDACASFKWGPSGFSGIRRVRLLVRGDAMWSKHIGAVSFHHNVLIWDLEIWRLFGLRCLLPRLTFHPPLLSSQGPSLHLQTLTKTVTTLIIGMLASSLSAKGAALLQSKATTTTNTWLKQCGWWLPALFKREHGKDLT